MLTFIRLLTDFNKSIEYSSKFTVGSQTATIPEALSDHLELAGCYFQIIFDDNKPFHYRVHNQEYHMQTVSIEQRITIKNPDFTIEQNKEGFFIMYDNKRESFDMTSTDYFSYHINSEKNLLEILIQWNNRTILSQNEIKLYYLSLIHI